MDGFERTVLGGVGGAADGKVRLEVTVPLRDAAAELGRSGDLAAVTMFLAILAGALREQAAAEGGGDRALGLSELALGLEGAAEQGKRIVARLLDAAPTGTYVIVSAGLLRSVDGCAVSAASDRVAIYPSHAAARDDHRGGRESVMESRLFGLDRRPANMPDADAG